MKNNLCLIAIFLITFSTKVLTQSNLPDCPPEDFTKEGILQINHWHFCYGTYIHMPDNKNKTVKYVGEFKNGIFHGNGISSYANGAKYEGEYLDGKKNGFGKYFFSSGAKYIGNYKDGKYHGQGTYIFLNGERYSGNYENGERSGKGEYINKKGDVYVGEYKYGRKNGLGVLSYANGDRYEGEYEDGKRNGKGTLIYVDGDRYIGDFKDDLYDNYGTLNYSTGDKYTGEYKFGKRNGKGIYSFSNGTNYEGNFENDFYHGVGTLRYANGDVYSGRFKNGQRSGEGIFLSKIGDKYEGDFSDDLFNGEGILNKSNGDYYIGSFKNGLFNGYGVLKYGNNDIYQGEFQFGKKNGYGVLDYANGNKYEGDFRSNFFNGKGIYEEINGDKYNGEFRIGLYSGLGSLITNNGYLYEGIFSNGQPIILDAISQLRFDYFDEYYVENYFFDDFLTFNDGIEESVINIDKKIYEEISLISEEDGNFEKKINNTSDIPLDITNIRESVESQPLSILEDEGILYSENYVEENESIIAERKFTTGLIISNYGHILTTYKNIKSSKNIYVKTIDTDFLEAKILSVQEKNNLAILKINGKNYIKAPIKISNFSEGESYYHTQFNNLNKNESKIAINDILITKVLNEEQNFYEFRVSDHSYFGNKNAFLFSKKGFFVGLVTLKQGNKLTLDDNLVKVNILSTNTLNEFIKGYVDSKDIGFSELEVNLNSTLKQIQNSLVLIVSR